jgi:hypothetical protein
VGEGLDSHKLVDINIARYYYFAVLPGRHAVFAAASFLLQGSTPAVPAPFGFIGIVAVVWCISRRNENIGGWLMFFYYQIYASIALFLFSALGSAEKFAPSEWRETSNYLVFLASVLPRYAAFLLVGATATVLVSKKTHAWVIYLRIALGAAIGLMALPLLLDALYFQDALIWNLLRVVMLGAWLIYFFVSERVKRVFPQPQPSPQMSTPSTVPFS